MECKVNQVYKCSSSRDVVKLNMLDCTEITIVSVSFHFAIISIIYTVVIQFHSRAQAINSSYLNVPNAPMYGGGGTQSLSRSYNLIFHRCARVATRRRAITVPKLMASYFSKDF